MAFDEERGKWVRSITAEGKAFLQEQMRQWPSPLASVMGSVRGKVAYLTRAHGYEWEELESLAAEGWVDAVATFDPTRGFSLVTHAGWKVMAKLSREIDRVKKPGRFGVAVFSGSRPLGGEDGDSLLDTVADRDAPRELPVVPPEAMRRLTGQERFVVEMLFGFNGVGCRTRTEIASLMSVGDTRVGQIAQSAIGKIRDSLLETPNLDDLIGEECGDKG